MSAWFNSTTNPKFARDIVAKSFVSVQRKKHGERRIQFHLNIG
jgi:hypothetical protein